MENKCGWMKEKEMGFKKGDRVVVKGVAGVGTVKHNQETNYVRVMWDGGDPHRDTAPHVSTLRLAKDSVMADAITEIEAKRQELLTARAEINEKLVNLSKAVELLRSV